MMAVTAEHGVFLALCALGIMWALYLLCSTVRDLRRRRPWWREPKGGDVIEIGRKRIR